MAIALKGTLSGVGSTSGGSNSFIDVSSLGIAAGDFIICGVVQGNSTANLTLAAPSGNVSGNFTQLADLYSNDNNDTNFWLYDIVATGADTSFTVSWTGTQISWIVSVYTGVDTTTPLDVTLTTATGGNSDTANAPSITPVSSGAVVVAVMAAAQSTSTAWTAPANLSNFTQQASVGKGRIAIGDATWSSGAFDPSAVTGGDGAGTESWAAATLALRPAVTSQSLTPSLFSNTQTIYASTVHATHGLTPSLFSNTQTIYASTVSTHYSLTPSLFTNSQTFYGPTISQTGGSQSLTPSVFTNNQSFFSASLTGGVQPITFVGSYVAGNVGATGAATTVNFSNLRNENNVQPTLAEGDLVLISFAVASEGTPGSYTAPSGYTELSSLFSDSVFDTTLRLWSKRMGAVPDTSVDIPTSGNLSRGQAYSIFVFRNVDTNTLDVTAQTTTGSGSPNPDPAAITPVSPGALIFVTGAGAGDTLSYVTTDLDSNTNDFRSAVGNDFDPIAVGTGFKTGWSSGSFNPVQFLGGSTSADYSWAAVTLALRPTGSVANLAPSLFTNTNSIYSHVVVNKNTLTPSLVNNSQSFYSPTVSFKNTLTPALVSSSNTFFSANIGFFSNLSPLLVSSSNTFFAVNASAINSITPGLYTNSSSTYAPSIYAHISPSLFTNTQNFYSATVTPEAAVFLPSLLTNTQTFYSPSLQSFTPLIQAYVFNNRSVFDTPEVIYRSPQKRSTAFNAGKRLITTKGLRNIPIRTDAH